MKVAPKQGRRLRSMVELAGELGKGKDVFVRGELRRNQVLKSLKWEFLADLVLSGQAFKIKEKRKSG